ncbi:MAG: hypothetical protein K2H01_11385 [Ruminococcus sp.]|nr:hypothetical protein [Ruminococcus sp.]
MRKNKFSYAHDKIILKRAYSFIFITMVVAYVLMCVLAVYAVSVLDRNDVVRQIDKNVNSITTYLEHGSNAEELIEKKFLDEYCTKTRVISVMISDAETLEENESTLEEIRVAVDAEEVSVFTNDGDVIATTATYGGYIDIDPVFREHMGQNNYNDAILNSEADVPYIAAAAQLSDKKHMLQIKYDAKSLMMLMDNSSIDSVSRNFPLYSDGDTVLIDAKSFTYVSHTDKKKIGMTCSIDPESFHRNKSKFDENISGKTVMVRYHKYDNYIIAAIVPYSDIFGASYAVLGWMIGGGVVILTVTALAMRMAKIRMLREYEKKYGSSNSKNK